MTTVSRRLALIGALLLAALACNLPGGTAPTQPEPGAAATAVAQTVAAAVSQTLVPSTAPPSLASEAPADTPAPSPTLSPTLYFTDTPAVPMISVSMDTNCRVGPGVVYDLVGGLFVGQTAQVYGKNPAGTFWYIRLPNNSGTFCWVTGQYASIAGDTSLLPVYTPPPTPTPMPDFDFAYHALDTCAGWWVDLRIKNVGALPFRSYLLTVKDLNTSVALTASNNGFNDVNGCLTSTTVASIEPGKVVILSAPAFAYNPSGHRIRATLKLCTKNGLAGVCVTNVITFKP
ncbi:MAG: hypothetical protein DYG87_11030 [Anaerolineae bacterium CFX3]|nr:hypothetical protein [Anaerolineales bacterium]MCE7906310.1 hypothetical protein [Anaerolineae bacterium CFX3]MCQ3947534.1 hypothetical protein [Anaerolineae bacterium]MCZ2287535.1 hypothetical protein [Anaerolineales bacterium]RIK26426.1 MAG: hypothetical protein DCC54_06920 [Anaerolineae bacterium]